MNALERYHARLRKMRTLTCNVGGKPRYERRVDRNGRPYKVIIGMRGGDLITGFPEEIVRETNPEIVAGYTGPTEEPHIYLRTPLYLKLPTGNYLYLYRTSVFTKTSKMAAPSFSLPAGPPSLGGACIAAAGLPGIDTETYICVGCYAADGNYGNSNVQLLAGLRLAWVRTICNSGAAGAGKMISDALSQYVKAPRKDEVNKIVQDFDYFRIHDSGDSGWTRNYLEAWFVVARRHRERLFWMPTRDWTSERMVARMRKAPKNLIIRPSALHYNEGPTSVRGLGAGSASMLEPGNAVKKQCPAYDVGGKSCKAAGCRWCWENPRGTVNYDPHGGGRRVARHNPPMSLEEAYEIYDQRRRNPPEPFPAFLIENGIDPASYTEDEWVDMLRYLGLDDNEASIWMEANAEWQMPA